MSDEQRSVTQAPGRFCPPGYGYRAADLATAPELVADTLYVVGGLYGNLQALDAIEAMAAREAGPVTLVFNGDFHWFDADDSAFRRVETVVADHTALRGNVETELAGGPGEAGCGCAYPEWVDDAEVTRSNAVLERLAQTAAGVDGAKHRLAALPMIRDVDTSLESGEEEIHGPGAEFRLERVNPLGELSLATPAPVGGSLYLRTDSRLYRFAAPDSPRSGSDG